MPTPDPKYAEFLEGLRDSIPELSENRIDKQYLAGPAEDGVELSVGVALDACSVRLVLSRHRVEEGETVLAHVRSRAGDEPATDVASRPHASRFSVVVSRPGSFPFSDADVVRAWVQMWVRRLGEVRSQILAGSLS